MNAISQMPKSTLGIIQISKPKPVKYVIQPFFSVNMLSSIKYI